MISFVIPALESDENYLYNCLNAIIDEMSKNGTDETEVIIVVKLEKSTEKEFLSRMAERYGNLVRFEFSDGNRSAAKNTGVKLAKNNIITFLDADTLIGRNFIPTTVRLFDDGHAYVNYSVRALDEEIADKFRFRFYSRAMNLSQWVHTSLGNSFYRPYGFCMSVRRDYCKDVAENGEVFLEVLAGHGEDSEFGRRYGKYCNDVNKKGTYAGKTLVKTSFREWYVHGAVWALYRMIRNVWEVPYRKKPVVKNWR